jgi:hypothetical protein
MTYRRLDSGPAVHYVRVPKCRADVFQAGRPTGNACDRADIDAGLKCEARLLLGLRLTQKFVVNPVRVGRCD